MKKRLLSISLFSGFLLGIVYLVVAFFSDYLSLMLLPPLFNSFPIFVISNILLAIIIGGLVGFLIAKVLQKILK